MTAEHHFPLAGSGHLSVMVPSTAPNRARRTSFHAIRVATILHRARRERQFKECNSMLSDVRPVVNRLPPV